MSTYITADCIISPLGIGTEQNLQAMEQGQSGIALQPHGLVADTEIMASVFANVEMVKGYTKLESLIIAAIDNVATTSGIDLTNKRTAVILSTTKGNVELLAQSTTNINPKVYLWNVAQTIDNHYHLANQTIVLSNACISGVSAMVVAKRLIDVGDFDNVVVVGADVLSHFITSGFLSFKSISANQCLPFDARRDGLNLGEACGALVISNQKTEGSICLRGGAISNDANHISGPSRTGYELNLAIRQAMKEANVDVNDISFVDTHGTATVYNDEMESKAVGLAELADKPIQSLKPYFGHTLGASGVIEAIVCANELKNGRLYGTLGFEQTGTPVVLKVSAQHQTMPMNSCVKTASGFGGCNAAIVLSVADCASTQIEKIENEIIATVEINNGKVTKNGEQIFANTEVDFATFIREAHKQLGETNMKFFKMDDMSKLGYVAAEALLQNIAFEPEKMGIVLSNSASSLDTDLRHQELINAGDAAASPAVFVYTLANVVIGEICIKHKIKGENTFFVSRNYNQQWLHHYAQIAMQKQQMDYCIVGWCNLQSNNYNAIFELVKK